MPTSAPAHGRADHQQGQRRAPQEHEGATAQGASANRWMPGACWPRRGWRTLKHLRLVERHQALDAVAQRARRRRPRTRRKAGACRGLRQPPRSGAPAAGPSGRAWGSGVMPGAEQAVDERGRRSRGPAALTAPGPVRQDARPGDARSDRRSRPSSRIRATSSRVAVVVVAGDVAGLAVADPPGRAARRCPRWTRRGRPRRRRLRSGRRRRPRRRRIPTGNGSQRGGLAAPSGCREVDVIGGREKVSAPARRRCSPRRCSGTRRSGTHRSTPRRRSGR